MNQNADRLPTIPAEAWTEEQRLYAQEIIDGPRGALISPFVPLLRSPELMAHTQRMGEYLRYRSALGLRLSELAIHEPAAFAEIAGRAHGLLQMPGPIVREERLWGFQRIPGYGVYALDIDRRRVECFRGEADRGVLAVSARRRCPGVDVLP